MKIDHQTLGTVDVCMPVGPLVDEDGGRMREHLLARTEGQTPRYVVRMEQVPYMDSAAVEGMLEVVDALQSYGMRLKLAEVTPTCREIFEITGLSRHFQFFESVEDAVRSFL